MTRARTKRPEFVDPADLRVIKAGDSAQRQFSIENADGRLEDFDKHYVHLSGFVGVHSPHTFAMAPKLLEHLDFAVKLLKAFPALSGSAQIAAMQQAIDEARAL